MACGLPRARRGDGPRATPPIRAASRFGSSAGRRARVGIVLLKRMLAAEGRFPAFFPWGNSGVFATTFGARQYLRVDSVEINGPFGATSVGDTPSRRRDLLVPPGEGGRRGGVRVADSRDARAARVPAAGRPPRRRRRSLAFYRARAATAATSTLASGRRSSGCSSTRLPVPQRARSGRTAAGRPYRLERHRAGVAAVVLPVEQHPGRRAAAAGRGRPAAGARRCSRQQVRRMLPDDRAPRRSSTASPRSGCTCATCGCVAPDLYEFPDWDDNLRQAMARETELFLEQPAARRPQPDRAAVGRLHVRQRAAGAPLRHSRMCTAATSGASRCPRSAGPGCSGRRAS